MGSDLAGAAAGPCWEWFSLAAGWGVVVCRVVPPAPADLAAVDALARLHLAARRCGCDLRTRGSCADLRHLWRWTGLEATRPLG